MVRKRSAACRSQSEPGYEAPSDDILEEDRAPYKIIDSGGRRLVNPDRWYAKEHMNTNEYSPTGECAAPVNGLHTVATMMLPFRLIERGVVAVRLI